ncbi:MAG: ABC transporter substrate-binding protein [Lachnospiraceae bacterium]|nr:ABC transporter substrate-binding protein [Lachnospiraceae bacterium]MBP5185348.1 ABC transporter substrate-binding protein [Lachnospiraceae bacterium]
MKKIRSVLSLVFIGIFALSLTACGKPAPTQEAGKNGGTVTVGITADIDGLDPHKIKSAGTREIMFNLYEGLVKVDAKGNIVGAVASEYEISADAMTYSFKLRKGVKFSNGKEVTANDVVYSLKRLAGKLENPDAEVAVVAAMSIVNDITASKNGDDDVITLKLDSANSELICYLTGAIVPEGYTTADGAAPGVGPFKYESYTPLQDLTIVKNENYYKPENVHLDKVVFKIMTDSDAAFMQVLAGAIDIYPNLTADQVAALPAGYRAESGGMALVQALFVNADVAPFNNQKVREALNYAIDRDYIIKMVGDGKGTPVCSGVFPGFAKYYDASLERYYTKDTAKAKELLKEAGFPDGFSFTITVPSNYKFHVDTAQVIAEQLKEVGVNARVEQVEWATWYSDVYKGEKYEGTIIGLDSNLAPGDILRFYPSTSSKNFMNYNSAEFDRIYALAAAEADDAKKVDYYKQLQQMLAKDAAAVFIQNPVLYVAVSDKLDGYTFYPLFVQDMSSIYFK